MSEVYQTDVTLRFFGDDLDPDEITRVLGRSPTHSERKGEVIVNLVTGNSRISRRGNWRFQVSRKSPGDLDAQISDIFDALSDNFSDWSILTQKYRADLFVGIFLKEENEGISLSPETIKKVAERNLLIDLDIYSPVYLN